MADILFTSMSGKYKEVPEAADAFLAIAVCCAGCGGPIRARKEKGR